VGLDVKNSPSGIRPIEKLGDFRGIDPVIGQFFERRKLSLSIIVQPGNPLLH